MALLLRTVRQNRWLKDQAEVYLAMDDVPADPLADLNTAENMLSVWQVGETANLERIVRAVAVGRDRLDHIGYVLFDSALLTDAGIDVRENMGTSADKDANAWHRDLVLTGNKVVALAKAILRDGDSGVVLKMRLKELVEEGIRTGQLPEKLRAKFLK
jgi:hypothetical protein